MAPSAIDIPSVQQTSELTATAVEKKIARTAASPLSQSKYVCLCSASSIVVLENFSLLDIDCDSSSAASFEIHDPNVN